MQKINDDEMNMKMMIKGILVLKSCILFFILLFIFSILVILFHFPNWGNS